MKLFVTGGAGFIGSNFIRYWIENHPDDTVINLDALTYAGNRESLSDVEKKYPERYFFEQIDIADAPLLDHIFEKHRPDTIVHFAAESHNSYAIVNPSIFFKTNVVGTQILLEMARKHKTGRFHHISTCEVYGDLALDSSEKFVETSPYRPRTPYNASKAGADHAVRAYFETFKLPVTISNCANNYGPYQFPEKIIPLFTTNLLEDQPIPLYKSSQNRREWLHVLDHCRAIDLILQKGQIGETYNIGNELEKSIEEIADILLAALGKPQSLKAYVEDRPGHDRRYLLDSGKIQRELGWHPQITFEDGIKKTVEWYKAHAEWWKPLKEKAMVHEGTWKK